MSENGIDDAYQRFAAMYANSVPIRGPSELRAAMEAGGIEPADVDEPWLRSLQRSWVYGESDEPFTDPQVNRVYRRLLAQT